MTPDDYAIANAMIRYGGSFVATLGQLWLKGDPENRRRIQATWPEYWQQYREMAARENEGRS